MPSRQKYLGGSLFFSLAFSTMLKKKYEQLYFCPVDITFFVRYVLLSAL